MSRVPSSSAPVDETKGPMLHQSGVMDQIKRRPAPNGRGEITCDSEIIFRFFYNDLDEGEIEAVHAHLEVCAQCKRELAAFAIAHEVTNETAKIEQSPTPQE